MAACIWLLAAPLLPLALEGFEHSIKPASVLLAAAMYVLGLGLASTSKSYFSLCLLAGFFASALFGFASGSGRGDAAWGWSIILAMAVVHFAERFRRHVVLREQFFEWER